MKIKFSKKDLTAVFKQLLKLARIKRNAKGVMISIKCSGECVFLCLSGVQRELAPMEVSGYGEIHLPLSLFESLVDTMSSDGFTIDCDGDTARVLQGRSVLTLPENTFREQFNDGLIKKQKKNDRDFAKAKKQLIKNMGGADQVVYLDATNQLRSGILVKSFKEDGKDKALIADESRNISEIFASQIAHTQRADVPLSDMWKAKIIIPLKF